MSQKAQERWQKDQQLGKSQYIVRYGVLFWGIPTGILWSIIMHFLQPQDTWYIRPIIAMIIFPLGGIWFGKWLWNTNVKNFGLQNPEQHDKTSV